MHHWKAEVTVTGIPVVTEEELESANSVIHGVLGHDKSRDELTLIWRFTNGSPDISDAIEQASAAWRMAVEHVEGAYDPVCTDFRVRRVEAEEG
jgi:hypothetical protein